MARRSEVYKRCKAEWERRRRSTAKAPSSSPGSTEWKSGFIARDPRPGERERGGGDWLVYKPELLLDAATFLATLRRLGYHLQDQRCLDLHRDLVTGGLIDPATGKWSGQMSGHGVVLANPETRIVCEAIAAAIASGLSKREALAEAVLELDLAAASFEAACQRLERLYDDFVETQTNLKKSHARRGFL